MPVSKAALRWARRRTSGESRASGSRAASSETTPRVSVPVLSVQRMSIPPRFSMASSRRTITPLRPCGARRAKRVTLMIAGSNSGESPTASATANEQRVEDRPAQPLVHRHHEDNHHHHHAHEEVAEMRMPRANSVSGACEPSRAAISPSAVARPVRTTSIVGGAAAHRSAENALLVRAASGASAATVPGCFSTGKGGVPPRGGRSLTRKSRASSTRPSAGTRLPAESRTTSPGTRSRAGTTRMSPPRRTRTLSAMRPAAPPPPSRRELLREAQERAAQHDGEDDRGLDPSRSARETSAAKTRMRTRGLANWWPRSPGQPLPRSSPTLLGPCSRSRLRTSPGRIPVAGAQSGDDIRGGHAPPRRRTLHEIGKAHGPRPAIRCNQAIPRAPGRLDRTQCPARKEKGPGRLAAPAPSREAITCRFPSSTPPAPRGSCSSRRCALPPASGWPRCSRRRTPCAPRRRPSRSPGRT